MCTLACWMSVFKEAPLVVAANRDEALERASSGPALRAESPRLVAPKDEVAGGTWWAVAETGLFVALTNRAGALVDPKRLSRGHVVEEVAAQGTVEHAEVYLQSLRAADYNGFHLFVSDGRKGIRAVADGVHLRIDRLKPGLHLLTERSFGAATANREDFARRLLEPVAKTPLDLPLLTRLLATHDDEDPLAGLCVHLPDFEYGTRSSAVLALGGARPTLLWTGEKPCESSFEDRSFLLETVLSKSSDRPPEKR